jgi:hypothetical protein
MIDWRIEAIAEEEVSRIQIGCKKTRKCNMSISLIGILITYSVSLWWAIIIYILVLFEALQSISATLIAKRLENIKQLNK